MYLVICDVMVNFIKILRDYNIRFNGRFNAFPLYRMRSNILFAQSTYRYFVGLLKPYK